LELRSRRECVTGGRHGYRVYKGSSDCLRSVCGELKGFKRRKWGEEITSLRLRVDARTGTASPSRIKGEKTGAYTKHLPSEQISPFPTPAKPGVSMSASYQAMDRIITFTADFPFPGACRTQCEYIGIIPRHGSQSYLRSSFGSSLCVGKTR
jgi:hypothetical protein